MSWKSVKIGDFLKRSKIPIYIDDDKFYKRVTIRTKHQGVSIRDIKIGKQIGTKKQFVLKKGQFVLSKIDARYGAFGIVPEEVDDAIITGNFWAYNVNESIMNINWLNHYTNSPYFYDLCERASSGITHRKYLNEDFFLNHELLIPDIEKQDLQVKLIERQKEIFNNLEYLQSHQLVLLNKLRQQILQDAVQGKLVPQDPNDEPASMLLKRIKAEKEKQIQEKKIKKQKPLPEIKPEEIPFEIPDNWVWCRLGEPAQVLRGISPKYSESGSERILNQKCVRWCFIKEDNAKLVNTEWCNSLPDERFATYHDVLVNSTGEGTIGRAAIVDKVDFRLPFDSHILKISSRINQKYLCFFINSMLGQAQVESLKGATSTKQTELGVNNLRNFYLPLPPIPEQNRIVKKIEQLMTLCDKLEQSIQQNQKYTKNLLQVALKEALEPK